MEGNNSSICKDTIKLIVYDFDGVMTDNRVLVDEKGVESVIVHRGDGYAVRMINEKLEIPQIILSTEANPVVSRRAEKLKIHVIHGVEDKATILKTYCEEVNISLENVLFVGNDLNDFDVMQLCGMGGCPADAEPEIKAITDWVSTINGGYGVIRELYRFLSWEEEANE